MSEYSSSVLFSFSAGKQRFTVKNLGIGINLDYFEIQLSPSKDNVITKIISDPTKVEL